MQRIRYINFLKVGLLLFFNVFLSCTPWLLMFFFYNIPNTNLFPCTLKRPPNFSRRNDFGTLKILSWKFITVSFGIHTLQWHGVWEIKNVSSIEDIPRYCKEYHIWKLFEEVSQWDYITRKQFRVIRFCQWSITITAPFKLQHFDSHIINFYCQLL